MNPYENMIGGTEIDPDDLIITDAVDEVVSIMTSPDMNPNLFERRVKCLMKSGMTETQSEEYAIQHPLQLSLFYDIGRGAFAVEASAVDYTDIFNPFTGQLIPTYNITGI